MQITIELPEDIGNQLQKSWQDLPQKILEAIALEAYRGGVMTSAQVQELLKFADRWETEQFLKQYDAVLDYTEEDLKQDIQNINQVLSQ
jgi:predicted HTH domain antitoxin